MTLTVLGLLYGALLLMLAAVSAVETAIYSIREVEGAAAGGEGADAGRESGLEVRLRRIRQNPFAQLQQTLLLSAALNLALALLGLYAVTGPLRTAGWNPWVAAPVLFSVTVLLGDALPKLFAVRRAPQLLVAGSRLLLPVRLLLDPLARWAERAAEVVLRRLVPEHVKRSAGMTRGEFETLVEMREEQRVLTESEAAMIQEVLEMEALNVRDAMVPRVDVTLVDAGDADAEVRDALENAVGRFVVVHGETPDVVEGVIDTLGWKLRGRPPWREALQAPVFIPETMPLMSVLESDLNQASACVLVVDEYGGLEGLVSQEEIADWLLHEAAPWLGEVAEIRELKPGQWLLDGGARLDHIDDVTSANLTPEGADGIDTVGGLVFKLLGRLPKSGDRLEVGRARLRVRRMARARVKQVELTLPAEHDAHSGGEGI